MLVVILAIGAFMNFASQSPWERFLWGPAGVDPDGAHPDGRSEASIDRVTVSRVRWYR